MIKVENSAEPAFLSSATVTNALDGIRSRVNAKVSPAIEKADEVIWRNKKVTDELFDSHHEKCCYCERKRDRSSEMDVEHYRPKGGVHGEDHKGYWWLVYTWNNLLWSCIACNRRYKGTHFTLLPGSERAHDEESDLDLELPYLINPKLESPEHFISFHIDRGGGRYFISAMPRGDIGSDEKKRAEETIGIVGLNRAEPGYNLIEERGDEFSGTEFENIALTIVYFDDQKDRNPRFRQECIDSIETLREQLIEYIRPDRIFAGVYRDFLRRHGIEYESLLEY